jgi:hypothetical protein
MNFYFLSRENDTYVLSFISRHDIREFESKVMKTVRF